MNFNYIYKTPNLLMRYTKIAVKKHMELSSAVVATIKKYFFLQLS